MSLLDNSEESTTPTTPSAGRQLIYPKSTGWFVKNSAGVETQLLTAVSSSTSTTKLPDITATCAASALTIGLSSIYLDFRSATLGSGSPSTILCSPTSLVISSGSTLGTTSAVQSRLAVIVMNNAGTAELAVVNLSGGTDLTETGLISTTAEGGAGAADSATVVYSTTARSSLPYRVIGYIESTQATAGTWATNPSTIQGAGGNALTAMSSLGYGQTLQDLTSSRALATTYYNTTAKPITIDVNVNAVADMSLIYNGVTHNFYGYTNLFAVIGIGASYSVTTGAGILRAWAELR